MKQRARIAAILVAILVAPLWVGQASAIDISFLESPDTGSLVSVSIPAGFPFAHTISGLSSETVTLGIAVPNFTFNRARSPVAALIERGTTPSNPTFSDLLFFTATAVGSTTTLTLEFQSEVDGQSLTGPFPPEQLRFVETGSLQLLVSIPGLPPGGDVTLNVSAQSDLNAVPEPGTVLLLGSGLLGLVAMCRRFRRS
jgi:hypothetical protein